MPNYSVRLGGVQGEEYGPFEARDADEAALACCRDMDHTRDYAVTKLSSSAGYGAGNGQINGNGAQDRSAWLFVTGEDGVFAGVYEVAEVDGASAERNTADA